MLHQQCSWALAAVHESRTKGSPRWRGGSNTQHAAPETPPTPETVDDYALASWEVLDPGAIDEDSTELDVGVTRVGCAGGFTGDVRSVSEEADEEQIIIQVYVEPLDEEEASCPANEVVEHTVELQHPVGDRVLVDGVCDEEESASSEYCEDPVRWP